MRAIIAFLLGLTIFSSPAHAQAAPSKDKGEEAICISGPSWRPTFADSRAIETIPVPASYRAIFESTEPCTRWSMGLDAIVDWHLRFGSTASVSAALAYIEGKHRSVRTPAAYLSLLRAAFAVAVPDLKHANALNESSGLSYSVRHRFMERRKTIARLKELLQLREDCVLFARQYLRAAEEFANPTLLTTAGTYIYIANAAADFLAPKEEKPPVQGLIFFNLHRFETDDYRARAALLQARISGSAADLERADKILKTLERPTDKAMADLVYSGGNDFCDIIDGARDSETIGAVCRADHNVKQRLSNIVINRAQYDAIVAGMEGKQLEAGLSPWSSLAERLLALEALPDHGRCCGRSVGEDRLRLLMTRAAYGARNVVEPRGAATSWEEKDRRSRAWYDTLSLLMQAERLAPPYTAPARFARLAQHWLSIWRAGRVVFADRGERSDPTQDPEKQRFAAYLTGLLGSLPGQAAPPP